MVVMSSRLCFGFQYLMGNDPAVESGIPSWVYGSFFFGAVCSIGSVWYSTSTTPEIAPDEAEIARLKSLKRGFAEPIFDILRAVKEMPKAMWQLAAVYLFQWYAMFCYWQYISHSIALSVWKTTAEQDKSLYAEAVGWTGLVNGFYNIITFLSAFGLAWLTKKLSPKNVHAICLAFAAASK